MCVPQLDPQVADAFTVQLELQAIVLRCDGQFVPQLADVFLPPHYVPQEAHIVVVRFEGQFTHPTAYALLQLQEKQLQPFV